MGIVWAIIVGAIVGALAKLIMPGRDPGGFWITALLGICGAIVAKLIGQAVGWYGPGDSVGIVASIIGAIVLLAIYRMFRRPTSVGV